MLESEREKFRRRRELGTDFVSNCEETGFLRKRRVYSHTKEGYGQLHRHRGERDRLD